MKTQTFPSVSLPISDDRLPVEVTLLHQFSIGAGTQLIYESMAKQSQHTAFIDELDEPSSKVGDMHFKQDDQSSLYTFAVERQGHPFHRHQGNRTFTAISGSGGTLLRFSLVSDEEMIVDEDSFIHKLQQIIIPPDCLFTVRFGGDTWHQFLPLTHTKKSSAKNSFSKKNRTNKHHAKNHPALFAVSCHTDELSGITDSHIREQVKQNLATIPSLTHVLPESLVQKLNALDTITDIQRPVIPTTQLALRASPFSVLNRLCYFSRHHVGLWRLRLVQFIHKMNKDKVAGYVA